MSFEKVKLLAFRRPKLITKLVLVALLVVFASDPVAAGDLTQGGAELIDSGP